MLIREATAADWPQVYPLFREIVNAGETYAYPEGLDSRESRALWMEPGARVVVAVEDATVLGSAKMGPNRPGRGSHIATASFMVAPVASGRGVGRSLGAEMIAWARTSGYHGIQFNAVVETNHAAVHLWRSLGFEILTTVPDAFDHRENGLVGLHLMFLRL